MANGNQASYSKIGFTVLIGITAIVCALIYLGGMRGHGRESIVETYYDKGVSGLSVGSAVNLRGVKVGEVREISFIGCKYRVDEVNAARIYIRMALNHKAIGIERDDELATEEGARKYIEMLIGKGLRATVASSGITGMSRIEFDFYPPEKASAIEKLPWTPKNLFVPPQVSLLDSFSDSATKVMNQINRMDISAAWSNISASVESLAHATDAAKVIMESRQADLEKIFDDFGGTMDSLKSAAREIKQNPSLLLRERKRRALPETER